MNQPCLISYYPNERDKFEFLRKFLADNQIQYEFYEENHDVPVNHVFINEKDLNFILLAFESTQHQYIPTAKYYKKKCDVKLMKWFSLK